MPDSDDLKAQYQRHTRHTVTVDLWFSEEEQALVDAEIAQTNAYLRSQGKAADWSLADAVRGAYSLHLVALRTRLRRK